MYTHGMILTDKTNIDLTGSNDLTAFFFELKRGYFL